MFSLFRLAIFSCAQIIVMETSSDFSRQFVVICTLNLSTGLLSCTPDVMCNHSLLLRQVSGNVTDIEFYYLLLLVHSPICKGPLMCGEWGL
uniref:Secreted protein n=1 Tax=Setaria viridis TaxID=4556 RepID=A0A4U6TH77_SETVI|nr:hypothetical protein SEVIR_8G075650v2 [Setaria viridis]